MIDPTRRSPPTFRLALLLAACGCLALAAGCGKEESEPAGDLCGNGVVDPGEACDEGGKSTATCNADCTAPSSCTVTVPDAVQLVVTDAMQDQCFDEKGNVIDCPAAGAAFHGQDAQYARLAPSYSACSGIVTDHRTGLMWEQAHHDERVSYADAAATCEALALGGYTDWRIPSIKELFSINDARGDQNGTGQYYLDSDYFDLAPPTDVELTGTHTAKMMGQTWSSTPRPDNSRINYFYNFLDGHIKSNFNDSPKATLFYRCVRGDPAPFASGRYTNNGDGTVTDDNTGLTWQRANGEQSPGDYQFSWEEALAYCEDLSLAGHDDWRLPDVKELQSIVDYDAPDYATTKMVLDLSVFEFNLPAGKDLDTPPTTSPPDGSSVAPFFWSSTTHGDAKSFASYVCFGPCWAVEQFPGTGTFDAHGPGAQRADFKRAPPNLPTSIGDQKDVVQIDNFVRCVRGGL